MGDIMKLLAPLMAGGSTQDKLTKLVEKVATPENIREYSGNIIEGYTRMQVTNGRKYVLYLESTSDGRDVLIKIWDRQDSVTLVPLEEIYLSRITQEQIISLISLFFKDGTTDAKLIAGPGAE